MMDFLLASLLWLILWYMCSQLQGGYENTRRNPKIAEVEQPAMDGSMGYQGSAKAPYIVSRKQGYKGNGYATEQQKAQEWQCSCKSWTTTVPRADCKHIVAIKLEEKILVYVTPTTPTNIP